MGSGGMGSGDMDSGRGMDSDSGDEDEDDMMQAWQCQQRTLHSRRSSSASTFLYTTMDSPLARVERVRPGSSPR